MLRFDAMAILVCLGVGTASAQPPLERQPFHIQVFDAEGRALADAKVSIHGQTARYGLHVTQLWYTAMGPATGTVELAVAAKGYLAVKRKIPATQTTYHVYLRRPADPWFTDTIGWPRAYSSRPRDVLVFLHDYDRATNQRIPTATAAATLLALPALAKWQLVEVDWVSAPFKTYPSRSRPVGTRLLLRAPRALPPRGVEALAALRRHAWVQFAGPIVVHGENYRGAMALGTRINVSPVSHEATDLERARNLVAYFGGRFRQASLWTAIEFDDAAGAIVVEAANALAASGLFRFCDVALAHPMEID